MNFSTLVALVSLYAAFILFPPARRNRKTFPMLKSHFDISHKDQDDEDDDDVPETPSTPQSEVYTPEVRIVEAVDLPRLMRGHVSERMSMLGKTAEGDGYAYLKASCVSMSLKSIDAITYFKHLQFVDVSDNSLTIEALQCLAVLPYLLLLHADLNQAKSAVFKRMKYLQVIIMNRNKITDVFQVYQPRLYTLELGLNKIKSIQFQHKMETLRILDLRENLIKDIRDLDLLNLDSLYLAGNKIKSLEGIDRLVNLRILHLRNNPLRKLDGFKETNEKLRYINLRLCKIRSLTQVRKLMMLPKLETIVLTGTPYLGGEEATGDEEDVSEQRIEIVASLPRLIRINKSEVTVEERDEAKELMLHWLEEGYKEVVEEEEDEESDEEHGGEGEELPGGEGYNEYQGEVDE